MEISVIGVDKFAELCPRICNVQKYMRKSIDNCADKYQVVLQNQKHILLRNTDDQKPIFLQYVGIVNKKSKQNKTKQKESEWKNI